MPKKPFFSVIIPLYNKENHIQNTIKSVLNQSFVNFEIIVVNDGSVDNSEAIVKTIKDPRINLFTIKNHGASYARNCGIMKANANYIALLDADDLWCNNHLETMYSLLHEFPTAGIYCSGYNILLGGKYFKKTKLKGIPYEYKGVIKNYFECNLFNSIVNSSVAVIPKHIFEDIGLFDVDMKSGQDTYFWTQIALKHKVVINNVVTAIVVKNDFSLSSSNLVKDRVLFLDKFTEQEKQNLALKKFMDMNRYSVALNFKINNKNVISKSILKKIDSRNINFRQKSLLYLPNYLLKALYKIKLTLDKKGVFFHLYR